MTGVIYARYSSDNQWEESIEGQLRECKAFAEKNDIQIVNTYIDRVWSAKTDNRPDFQRMIKDSEKGILLESMLEGMAEYYSAELSEKFLRGLTENAFKCKYNGGTLPIGYTIDENQYFQIDPLTAPAVLDAFKQYAEGASMQEVTDKQKNKHKQRYMNTAQPQIYR